MLYGNNKKIGKKLENIIFYHTDESLNPSNYMSYAYRLSPV
uniref:Uncharacterized protein n=1 Tax=uncultured Desulfobacterium sp. TaxID=201089 RepID=E1YBM5_9BACT|nr:unknown protein [uncultured Desulfobacterium sp.]